MMRMAILFIIFVTYLLSGYDFGSYMFFANVFMWLVCIILAVRPGFEKEPVSDPSDPVALPALYMDSIEPG